MRPVKRLAMLSVLASFLAHAQQAPKVTEVLVLASAATQLTLTAARHGIEIQNLGPNSIFCAFTAATAVLNKARRIAAGASWSLDIANPPVFCIAATADQVTGAATIVSEIP